jgi:hypothetical protein
MAPRIDSRPAAEIPHTLTFKEYEPVRCVSAAPDGATRDLARKIRDGRSRPNQCGSDRERVISESTTA